MTVATEKKPTKRGTTNRNCRGNNKTRRQRREWLVATYRANVDIVRWTDARGQQHEQTPDSPAVQAALLGWLRQMGLVHELVPACRCYRCALILTVDTVTADRIKPGAEGGKYRTPIQDRRDGVTNVRPACLDCNSETGGKLGSERKLVVSSA